MAVRGGYSSSPGQYSQVLIYGDSWANYMWPCWPERLAQRLGVPTVVNFAVPGSTTADLPRQATATEVGRGVLRGDDGKTLRERTLCVVHTGGNDFLRRFGMDALKVNPGREEATKLEGLLDALHRAGCRDFLVSDVPLSLDIPMVKFGIPMVAGAVAQGLYAPMGIERGDGPELAIMVQQTALHDAWDEAIGRFLERARGVRVCHFNEPAALHRIKERSGTAGLWDMSQFHPTEEGHRKLAAEAADCLRHSNAPPRPAVSPSTPSSSTQAISTPATTPATPAPSPATPAPAGTTAAAPTPNASAAPGTSAVPAASAAAAPPVASPPGIDQSVSIPELEKEKRKAFDAKDFAQCKRIQARINELRIQEESKAANTSPPS
eukprot:Hpha_TRINITY_DN16532_c2_g7::TRINITY_DN16532_c2_g7_i1::g.135272::m.135272